MDYDPNKIMAKVVEYGNEWADKQEAADLLDEEKKNVLARLKLSFKSEKSDAAKETLARAENEWTSYIVEMCKAKKEATKAKVRYDAAKSWADGLRTKAANLRAEMKL